MKVLLGSLVSEVLLQTVDLLKDSWPQHGW